MPGTWTASIDDLKAVTAFLEGLTELTRNTGVMACMYSGTYVETNGGVTLQINSHRDAAGEVSYFVDEHGE